MSKTCLMVETADNRQFLTHEKNYPQLIEFSKTFGAEISVVKIEDPSIEVLTLDKLSSAICDSTYKQKIEFEIVEPKITVKRSPRSRSKKIRDWINIQLLTGKPLRLSDVYEEFNDLNLTKAAFCTHYAAVRKEAVKAGKKIEKVGGGTYKVIN